MLEVCVDSEKSARIAVESGADRLELCSALSTGGVTPTGPLIHSVRRLHRGSLIVLIRCREGDFHYDAAECALMLAEIEMAIDVGVNGVAVGGLLPNGSLDLSFLTAALQMARSRQVECVMHRAFDLTTDRSESLEQLCAIGFDRILTSGGFPDAQQGMASLAALQRQAKDRIQILPGGGIRSNNASMILAGTGCTQLHSSCRLAGQSLPDAASIRNILQLLRDR